MLIFGRDSELFGLGQNFYNNVVPGGLHRVIMFTGKDLIISSPRQWKCPVLILFARSFQAKVGTFN